MVAQVPVVGLLVLACRFKRDGTSLGFWLVLMPPELS